MLGYSRPVQAAVVDRELEPRHVQHRDLADADGRVVRGAEARIGIDVDALRAQFPVAVVGRAGRIGRTQQRALGARHLDGVGAAVAASLDQLVAHVVDLVRVLALVALRAVGDHAHARILVAHVAVGDVLLGLLVEGEVVGVQELVAALERDVALEVHGFAGSRPRRCRRPRRCSAIRGPPASRSAAAHPGRPGPRPPPGTATSPWGGRRRQPGQPARRRCTAAAAAGGKQGARGHPFDEKRPLACRIACQAAMRLPACLQQSGAGDGRMAKSLKPKLNGIGVLAAIRDRPGSAIHG